MATSEMDYIDAGGSVLEITIWSNSSPNSSFSNQSITLSEGISHFKQIKFIYKVLNTDDAAQMSITLNSDELSTNSSTGAQLLPNVYMGGWGATNTAYARGITYTNDTTLYMGSSYRIANTGNNNNTNIPLSIIGLK